LQITRRSEQPLQQTFFSSSIAESLAIPAALLQNVRLRLAHNPCIPNTYTTQKNKSSKNGQKTHVNTPTSHRVPQQT